MSESSQPSQIPGDSSTVAASTVEAPASSDSSAAQPKPSYVKLAMRNMVRKRGKSLYHFTLTFVGLLGVLIGLAFLTH